VDRAANDVRSDLAVGSEWIAHGAGRRVERPLGQAGHPRGNRRLEVGHSPQRGQYVVGSNRHSDMADDRVEYGTWLVLPGRIGHFSLGNNLKPHHRLPSIERAQAGLGHPLDLDVITGPKSVAGRRQGVPLDAGEFDAPLARLKALREVRTASFYGIHHVKPLRQRPIQGGAYGVRIPR